MPCIDGLHVPALHTFSTDLAIDAHVFAFLSQHPGIQELHLGGDLVGGTDFVPTYLLPNLCILEAPLPLATTLVPYRPVSRLKVWASYDQLPDVAVAEAMRQTECMRLSTAAIVSFRFEDGPPYAPAIHKHGASCFYHLRLLGLLFIDREEEDQVLDLVHLTPNLEVLQIDNAMANRRGTSEQRDFAFRLGCVFKSLKLVSFEDDYQNMHWGRVGMSTRGRKPYARPPPPAESADGLWVHDLAPGADEGRKARPSSSNAASESNRLYVSNLHYEVTQKDLASIFGTIGTLLREPTIRYDRSGRSTGLATVQFANARDAKLAQKQLDGVLAKGEAMSIKLDTGHPPRSRAAEGRTSTSALLNRMDKKSLADRLADSGSTKPAGDQLGPVRSAKQKGKTAGKHASGKPARTKPAPKTAEDLDKELEAFMGEGEEKASKEKEDDTTMV
ncbi:hypothetical protein FRC06_006708 [Ceratobasidium sp. 370]|nr:hypothetical protein FRC06_006708 [Ceratobasidium sp. 370]